jgi:hypothetical protein
VDGRQRTSEESIKLFKLFNLESAVRDDPRILAYGLTVDPANPGCIILIWRGFGRLITEPIRSKPTEFRFRHVGYDRLEQLITFWKEHGCKSLPDQKQRAIERRVTEGEESVNREKQETCS